MSYNFLAESSGEPDWGSVAQSVAKAAPGIEAFPIPAAGPEAPHALGISVPMRHANETTWRQLEKLLTELRSRHTFAIYELYTGEEVTRSNLPAIRERLIG